MDTESYPLKYSFRVLFKHSEHIDFYAENADKYETWMKTIEQVMRERPEEQDWLGEELPESASSEVAMMAAATKRRPGVSDIQWSSSQGQQGTWLSSHASSEEEEEQKMAHRKSKKAPIPLFGESAVAKSNTSNNNHTSTVGRKKVMHYGRDDTMMMDVAEENLSARMAATTLEPMALDSMVEEDDVLEDMVMVDHRAAGVGVFGTSNKNRRREY